MERRTPSGRTVWRFVLEEGSDPKTGKRRRGIRGGFPTRQEALRALRERQAAAEGSDAVARSDLTVGEFFLDDWLPSHRVVVRANTLVSYRSVIDAHIVPRLGAVRLQDLSPRHLNTFYTDLLDGDGHHGAGLSYKSIRNIHAVLHRALRDAVQWGMLATNPAGRAKPPSPLRARRPGRQQQTWTADQVRVFLEGVEGDDLRALWWLAATTGMRRSEILGLRWRDIDLDTRRLSVIQTVVPAYGGKPMFSEPKTARSARSLPITEEVAGVMTWHRRRQLEIRMATSKYRDDLDLIFADSHGEPIRPARVSRRFRRLADAAELPRIRFHDLRHTWATLALPAGVHPKVVSEYLGHANIGITLDTYSHLVEGLHADAAQRVGRLIHRGDAE